MNPVEEQLPPPPQPPQPRRTSTSCDRHPDEHFPGFCPSCLFERLAVLDQTSSPAGATTAGRKSASAAIKSIFRGSNNSNSNYAAADRHTFRNRPGAFLPELRRTKSFSGGKNDGFTGIVEPPRNSCDVRARGTLWSLFNQDDGKFKATANATVEASSSFPKGGADQIEGKLINYGNIVIELKEEEECEQDLVSEEEKHRYEGDRRFHHNQINSGEIEEIEEIEEPVSSNNITSHSRLFGVEQLRGMQADLKSMNDDVDLNLQSKKVGGKDLKDIAGSFWTAASVFSKKLRSWTKKNNKLKKHSGGRTLQVSKKSNGERSYRETQSEVADYGYGRRSCDIDPRFSVDASRISIDDPRYSFDEPRASWDGYLIGGGRSTNFSRVPPVVLRRDFQIPVEEPRRSVSEENGIPGGAAQTKDYYSDSFSRRRKSLDRSSSIRRTLEVEEVKSAADSAKVYDCSESFDHGDRKAAKKSKSWRSWNNIWGLIGRRSSNKDEDRYSKSNGVERSCSESWQELSRDPRGGFNKKIHRSNSSLSRRNGDTEDKKKSNEFVLERNRSARYSPADVNNGVLRFNPPPVRCGRRGSAAKSKPPANSDAVARSMLRMY